MPLMHVLRLLGLVLPVGAHVLMPSPTPVPPALTPPLAEVFVISLEKRKDKCLCMQHQLQGAPWPVHRFPAVNRESVLKLCPHLVAKGDDPQRKANAALLCSNQLILERFLHRSHSEHLVIFEDDSAILDPNIFKRLGAFLRNPCAKWDYLLVDPWGSGPWTNRRSCGSFETYDLTFGHDGSHLQVFNRRVVKSLIEYIKRDHHDFLPVTDKLFEVFRRQAKQKFVPLVVIGNITTQAQFYMKFTGKPLACAATVTSREDREARLGAVDPKHLGHKERLPFFC